MATGDVYTWGSGWLLHPHPLNDASKPWVDKSFIKKKIFSVSAGFDMLTVLTTGGELLLWGLDGVDLSTVDERPRIMSVACGSSFLALLTETSEIWMCGDNTYGQLGHSDVSFQAKPRKANGLSGKTVKMVSCGSNHTAAITIAGDLYTWGRGMEGQLGHGKAKLEMAAKSVRAFVDAKIVFVACGSNHTVAVLENGSVATWGEGSLGQLGHGRRVTSQLLPIMVKYDDGATSVKCTRVAAGWGHTLALTNDGQIWSWGFGSSGQLGTGDLQVSYVPQRVTALQGQKIIGVYCGSYFSYCEREDHNIFVWGSGEYGRLGIGSKEMQPLPKMIETIADIRVTMFAFSDSRCICFTPTRLISMTPSKGPISGGTRMKLSGVGIYDCWIMVQFRNPPSKNKVVRGKYDAKTGSIRVVVPEFDHVGKTGRVAVEVTLDDGATYTSNGLTFGLYLNPKIQEISPAFRPLAGSYPITIIGDNFSQHDEAVARFIPTLPSGEPGEAVLVKAVYNASSGHYLVESPEIAHAGSVSVELSFNGCDFTQDGLSLTYYDTPQVLQLLPSCGRLAAHRNITIQGLRFVNLGGMCLVKFTSVDKSVTVKGTVVDSEHISCDVPIAQQPGPAYVEVALNGRNFTDDMIRYYFYDVVQLISVSPPFGHNSGGTEVTIACNGAVCVSSAMCMFSPLEKESVQAEASDDKEEDEDDGAGEHEKRNHMNSTVVAAKVSVDGHSITLVVPPKLDQANTEVAKMELTLDGEEYLDGHLSFSYYEHPAFGDVKPNKGAVGKELQISIPATGLFPSEMVMVKLEGAPTGDVVIHGSIVDVKGGSEVQCLIPATAITEACEVQVSVAMNGQQYSTKKSLIAFAAGKK